ncbi:hypothetical protein AB0M31_20855 [Streptomyces sp. NPDC051773]|uniref:hypothetical protein n=1 Tax=Streptomyces sp. NPDC051773 TaxID=3156682 RepID=UPI003431F9C8
MSHQLNKTHEPADTPLTSEDDQALLALRRELATDDTGAFAYEEVEALLVHGMVLATLRPRESVRPLLEGLSRAQEADDRETGLRLAAALVDAYRADPAVADVVRELTCDAPDWLRDRRG